MKKEICIERRCSEEERNIKKTREELDVKEIEIEKELRILTERKQDILTYSLKSNEEPIIVKMSFDFKQNLEISYRVVQSGGENPREETINKKTKLLDNSEMRLERNKQAGLGIEGVSRLYFCFFTGHFQRLLWFRWRSWAWRWTG